MTTEDPLIAKGRKAPTPSGDTLAQTVADMSDAELREVAGAVLSELRARISDPSIPGFSHQNLISDLQRRLADAHSYAQSGFGRRDRRLTKPAAGSRALPAPAPLSDEKKAMLLTGLEAELLSDAGSPDAEEETADLAAEGPVHDEAGQPDGGESSAPSGPSSVSFEAEIWEALQIGVGRSAVPAPTKKEETPPG